MLTDQQIDQIISKMKPIFITKEDAKNFLTKEDAKSFATKEDIKNFATKDDLKNFATKDDLKQYATLEQLDARFFNLQNQIDDLRGEMHQGFADIGSTLNTMLTLLDPKTKELSEIRTEHTVLNHTVLKHDKWIRKAESKLEIQLD